MRGMEQVENTYLRLPSEHILYRISYCDGSPKLDVVTGAWTYA
jgi:hypothetical protein